MSTLVAIAYPDRETAEKVRQELIQATKEHLCGSRMPWWPCTSPTARSSCTRPRAPPAPAPPAARSGVA